MIQAYNFSMKMDLNIKRVLAVFAYVGVIALLGAWLSAIGLYAWYGTIILPEWAPAGDAISIIWTLLYALLALSMLMALERMPPYFHKRMFALYAFHAAVNVLWSYVFFVRHDLVLAGIVALLLLAAVGLIAFETNKFARFAAFLLVPYFLWVGFATYLNFTIANINLHPEPSLLYEDNSNDLVDFIRLSTPAINAEVSSALHLEGEARGTWFFEASFPVVVYDKKGNTIGSGYAEATDNWMTEEFVPFKADLVLTSVVAGPGTIELKKDNPSGNPELDKSLYVPITLLPSDALASHTFTIGESFVMDGTTFTLDAIDDSRCPPTVACIWEGELSPLFTVERGAEKSELRLGTVTRPEAEVSVADVAYHVTLGAISEDSVAIMVK